MYLRPSLSNFLNIAAKQLVKDTQSSASFMSVRSIFLVAFTSMQNDVCRVVLSYRNPFQWQIMLAGQLVN